MKPHRIVSQSEWLVARKALLAREKQLTRLHDEIAAERLDLPWVRVDKPYAFAGPDGRESLADLFGSHSQLLVYHFMFGPTWQEGCPSCSFLADHLDGTLPHLAARDVELVVISRAPYEKLAAFRERMGWRFKWVSSFGSDFNRDFHASFSKEELAAGKVEYNYTQLEFPSEEAPGTSAFYKDAAGNVFHTYSAYARGGEPIMTTYMLLDMAPKGRDEGELGFSMEWVRHHDRYAGGEFADADKPYWPKLPEAAGREGAR